jgi:16S rRNA pseudouridine516 synthase
VGISLTPSLSLSLFLSFVFSVGDLVQRIITPRKRVGVFGKVYHIKLQNPLSGKEPDIFASGELVLKNETRPCKPAKFEILNYEENLVRF